MRSADVLVIGGGPGGYVAAIRLGQLGKRTVLVDAGGLGGACLHAGCIPSKAFIGAGALLHKVRKAEAVGLTADGLRLDLAKLVAWKNGLVQGLAKGVAQLLKGNGVEVLQGTASLAGPGRAVVKGPGVEGGEEIAFGSCILAAGSRTLELPGFRIDGQSVLGSKEALDLPALPARLAVIGAGAIGLELGTFFAKLGSKVTVIEMLDQLLPGLEADLVAPVARSLKRLGVTVHLGARADSWEKAGSGLRVKVHAKDGEEIVEADRVLLSIGRLPSTGGLGLASAGVETTDRGFVKVDESMRTTADAVYAIGDVTGPPYLAHRASREGVLVAEAIASGEKAPPLGPVPAAIFTDPEIATAGLTEPEARRQGLEVETSRFPFAASGRAQAERETDGFVKVVAEKGSGRILGTAIVGPEATDLISEAALAIRLKATVHDVAGTIHPHPTLPEAFLEAAEAGAGRAVHFLARR